MSRRPANNIARLTEDVGPLTPSTPEQVEAVRQLLTLHQATDLADMLGVPK